MSNKDKVEKAKLEIKNYGKTELEKFDGGPNSNLILFKEQFEFFAAMGEWEDPQKDAIHVSRGRAFKINDEERWSGKC